MCYNIYYKTNNSLIKKRFTTTYIINAILLLQFKFISLIMQFASPENLANSKDHKSLIKQKK